MSEVWERTIGSRFMLLRLVWKACLASERVGDCRKGLLYQGYMLVRILSSFVNISNCSFSFTSLLILFVGFLDHLHEFWFHN